MKGLKLTIIDWYIIRKFLGTFVFAIALIVVIAVVFDLSEHIDDFFEHDAPVKEIVFSFYLNFIPYFVILFSSLITFIAVIFFTSKMAYNTEIIAILSSGVSFWRLMYPFFISAFIIASGSFFISNYILPPANKKRLEFTEKYIQGGPRYYSQRNIHKQIQPGVFVFMENFSNHTKMGHKFSMERFEKGQLSWKLMADYAKWDTTKQKWTIRNYYIRTIQADKETIMSGQTMDTTLNMLPSDFETKQDTYFETMTLGQLNHYIDELSLQGADNINVYLVERGKRLAFPFSTFILTFIGVTLSSRKVKGGIGMHIGAGLALSFSYIFFMQFSAQFAISGSLPATVAAWIPNTLYSFVCVFLYKIAPK